MSKKKIKLLILLFVIFSFIGFLDASFLTFKYYSGLATGCLNPENCDKVTASEYATIGSVPVALFGAVYYFTIFLFSVFYFLLKKVRDGSVSEKIINLLPYVSVFGFLASIWFVYLQLFVIKAICVYCMISAGTSTILFIFGLIVIKSNPKLRITSESTNKSE